METKNTKEEEIEHTIRAEEVQDIMERMPKKLIKWGSGAVVLLILILFGLSAIIQYPDTIKGTALLTTKQPPIAITAKTQGIIERLFVTDKSEVKAENTLAIIKNRTDYATVFWLDSVIHLQETDSTSSNNTLPGSSLDYNFWLKEQNRFDKLGELTYAFSGFLSSLKEFHTSNIKHLSIESVLKGNGDKKLYDKAWTVLRQLERLKAAIVSWKEKYLLKSPTDGIVSFHTPRVENQELKIGDEFCKIISNDKEIICKILIPLEGAAKVISGQKVRLVLTSYPENEFGFIEGVVKTVSVTPVLLSEAKYNYVVTVNVPQPLITSTKKEISYIPEMQGTAEIITEKKTILNRITGVLINYWSDNK